MLLSTLSLPAWLKYLEKQKCFDSLVSLALSLLTHSAILNTYPLAGERCFYKTQSKDQTHQFKCSEENTVRACELSNRHHVSL